MLDNKTKSNTNAIDGQVNAPPNSETLEDQCPYCESNLQCANCGAPMKLTDPLIMGENGIYCSMNCKSVEE